MKRTMSVVSGSNISADNFTITIEEGDKKVFENRYNAGYTYSWKKEHATEDKPFKDDLIAEKAAEYEIELSDIKYSDGINKFAESKPEVALDTSLSLSYDITNDDSEKDDDYSL